jgi:sugar lactone lactonase YvrE
MSWAVLVCLIFLCILPGSASAALPSRPFLPSVSLDGSTSPGGEFDHACGVAFDSEGDLYVANASQDAIRIFGPSHAYVGTVANTHEPCGLGVDSTGRLYVSQRETGEVVRYTPTAYPFSGAPSYGAPVTVDASGTADGIAVDPRDNSLYVAEGSHVAVYAASGEQERFDEVQEVFVFQATGGTFKLVFEGEETAPLPFNATAAEVQIALEGLSAIGAGNVSVEKAPPGEGGFLRVTFVGALGHTDVPQLSSDGADLTGSGSQEVEIRTKVNGFDGKIGEGVLSGATGVAVFSFGNSLETETFVSAVEPIPGRIDGFTRRGVGRFGFIHRTMIDGSETPDGTLGLASSGAYLGVDSQTGHIFALDAVHRLVNEFEATGGLVSQSSAPGLVDAEPTALAIDRSGGATDGDLFVSVGAGTGSEVVAFGRLNAPTRASLGEPPSQALNGACGVEVDRYGDLYVAGETQIKVYSPGGTLLTSITDPDRPCFLAVDSEGNLYAADFGTVISGDEKVVLYRPSAFPPVAGMSYSGPATIDPGEEPKGIGVDPETGEVYVSGLYEIAKYRSAAEGSSLITSKFGGLRASGGLLGIDVYGRNHNVYVAKSGGGVVPPEISIFNEEGTEEVGSFPLAANPGPGIAIDQSDGHVISAAPSLSGTVEEYESSGALVGKFGSFPELPINSDVAVDNSGGPGAGRLYVAYGNEVKAFGPLVYGEPPIATTGAAGEIGGGAATLAGTVNPNGFPLEVCRFEIVTELQFQTNGFSGATSEPCEPGPGAIGEGEATVPVHAQVTGLDPAGRYRFRLLAISQVGTGTGSVATFGPPVVTARRPQPIAYDEATLRGTVDPAGLATTYRYEYGPTPAYGSSTAAASLPGSTAPVAVEVPIVGLTPGATYHFRLVAENDDMTVASEDGSFTTLPKPAPQSCPNETLRLENNSAGLPDCRAYELVTPADMHGGNPYSGFDKANVWHVSPYGPTAGERLTFTTEQTLPGTEGNGVRDTFRASRGSEGWSSVLYGPSGAEAPAIIPEEAAVSPDQTYSAFGFDGATGILGFLRTPSGFEALGRGRLGTDPLAGANLISPQAEHVIFSTLAGKAIPLEPNAPPEGVGAVYDRSLDGPTRVVSLLPGNVTPVQTATFEGATEDGRSVVFSLPAHTAESGLYLRRHGSETLKLTDAGGNDSTGVFAGISTSGNRVFFTTEGKLFAFDAEGGNTTEIASDSRFAVVSEDGSHVYFLSEQRLDAAGEGVPGKPNLYVWNGSTTELVAVLGSMGELGDWAGAKSKTEACVSTFAVEGRGSCPVRTNPAGTVLVFESRQDLTGAETEGHSEVYRFQAGAGGADRLRCVSCDPSGAPASGDARLQNLESTSTALATDLIPNVTSDGNRVFFEADDRLLPEDANSATDVYEWKADGTGGCESGGGCLSLISSGQSDGPSYLYAMTPDGHDVFFLTSERLTPFDIVGSSSIYDARVDGGFPVEFEAEPCEGDACQGEASRPPVPPVVRSGAPAAGQASPHSRHCRAVAHDGKRRRVKRRCGRVHHHHAHRRHKHRKQENGSRKGTAAAGGGRKG